MNHVVRWLPAALLLGGCFDPPNVPTNDTESGTCMSGEVRDCTCDDGVPGTQTCGDFAFGACECDAGSTSAADSGSSGMPPDDTTGTTTGMEEESGPPPQCLGPEDCEDQLADTECQVASCRAGMCVIDNVAAGAPCGSDEATGCDAADTCDGRGTCIDRLGADGNFCDTCAEGTCSCTAGECAACPEFAPSNGFESVRSIAGWEMTGSWGRHGIVPASLIAEAIPFGSQALGSDGNRVAPYPGIETENSYARTPPTELPAAIEFRSWHMDEGGQTFATPGPYDNKRVAVSVDGGTTWTELANCSVGAAVAFCDPRSAERAGDDWDMISLPVPAELVGQSAIVEFSYDTLDDCCGEDRGWYIDDLNVGQPCACMSDDNCAAFTTECATASTCGGDGTCVPVPEPVDTACGDPASNNCSGADRCDAVGNCLAQDAATFVTECLDCASGDCTVCIEGTCGDCVSAVNDFSSPLSIADWTIETLDPMIEPSGWGIYRLVPRTTTYSPGMNVSSMLPQGAALGVDGNRSLPYPGGHLEHSRITTPMDLIPAVLTFDSWSDDEGGMSPSAYDNKIIEVSVDGGATWDVIVNCNVDADIVAFPFCEGGDGFREIDDWDAVTVDMSLFAGQMGQLRLTYNSTDGCCGFERGWYIDNLNFAQACD